MVDQSKGRLRRPLPGTTSIYLYGEPKAEIKMDHNKLRGVGFLSTYLRGDVSYRKAFFVSPDTTLGESFTDICLHQTFSAYDVFIRAFKNAAYKFFRQENILLNYWTQDDAKVRYHADLAMRTWGRKGTKRQERISCEGITIPLKPSLDHGGPYAVELYIVAGNSHAELVDPMVGLRLRLYENSAWFNLPPARDRQELKSLMCRFCNATPVGVK